MSTTSPTIPAETARHVLWMFGNEGGYRPGSFTQRLLELLAHADRVNLAKLAQAYPAEAAAVDLAQNDENGIAKLTRISVGQAPLGCKCGDTAGPFDLQGRCETCTEAAA
ncbi:hypothetical protein ACIRLA_22290 [Streptomyces sp. NPDC102364]|uniref:hypothetical protein n=1 Tax=Streptomyces sp. NPDC102364 TaxID=3366161 RepID=UPI00380A1EAF